MASALGYHLATSHFRNRPTGRPLNWGDQPVPFKLYQDAPTFHLNQDLSLPDIPLSQAFGVRPLNPKTNMPTLLAGVCNLTAGLTRVRKQPDGRVFHFRAVPSAGALYPTELYVALQNVNGMNDGLYHFCPLAHVLTPLRKGQVFSALGGEEPIIRFYLTSIFHRSAWKYGARAYRYCLLDAGHMVENLFLAARMHGLPASVDYDFDDDFINNFLCVDPRFEGCVAQVHALGCGSDMAVYDTVPPIMDTLSAYSRCAQKSDAPSELMEVHQLCAKPASGALPLVPPPAVGASQLSEPHLVASASATIQKRRSARNFETREVPVGKFTDILGWLCEGQVENPWASSVQTGVLANSHFGITPGYHHLDRRTRATVLSQSGSLMQQSANLCLDQGWLGNAALHLTLTADLAGLEQQAGARTYRYAHLEAGRLGQRAYLAATANSLGACGVGAFFDPEAAEMLALTEGHHLLYLVAVGPVKK